MILLGLGMLCFCGAACLVLSAWLLIGLVIDWWDMRELRRLDRLARRMSKMPLEKVADYACHEDIEVRRAALARLAWCTGDGKLTGRMATNG